MRPTRVKCRPGGLGRTVPATILFCDLSQSTRFASVLGEREYAKLLQAFQAVCLEELDTFEAENLRQGIPVSVDGDIRGDQICVIGYSKREHAPKVAARLLDLARDLKVGWLLSKFNRVSRVGKHRPPVGLMQGLHSGEVTVGPFPRWRCGSRLAADEPVARYAEGYAISIAKRVEGSARQGQSWQIMLTDPTLELLRGQADFEFRKGLFATLTGGVEYPVAEILDLDPSFGNYLHQAAFKRDLSEMEFRSYLAGIVDLDPTAWHYLVRSYWCGYRYHARFMSEDLESIHRQALVTNPDAERIVIAQAVREIARSEPQPERALRLLGEAERRTQRSLGIYPRRAQLLRAMALFQIARLASSHSGHARWDKVRESCELAHLLPECKQAARCLRVVVDIESDGAAPIQEIDTLSNSLCEGAVSRLIRDGLHSCLSKVVNTDEIRQWKERAWAVREELSNVLNETGVSQIGPLLEFLYRHHKVTSDHRSTVYGVLAGIQTPLRMEQVPD